MKSILIKNARLIDPASNVDSGMDIWIQAGRVFHVGAHGSAPGSGMPNDTETIDAKGLWLIPGLIDLHVHLREPGQEGKETIASGTRAAAAGGITTVVAMPNTLPATDNVAILELVKAKAKSGGVVNVLPSAAITLGRQGAQLTEIGELAKAGAVMFTDDGEAVMNAELMRRALEYASMFDVPLMQHCEDKALTADGVMNEGEVSARLGLRGYPKASEAVIVARDIVLAEATGGRVHMGHISGKASIEMIREAKKRGMKNVTCETAPHYFSLTDAWISEHDYSTYGKMNPPLGAEEDKAAVIAGILDGTIDAIATDHAPHSSLDKQVEFDKAAFGIIGLETSLAVTLTYLVEPKLITPSKAVELLSANPAKILKLTGKGTLAVGSDADLVLVDPEKVWKVEADKFQSKSRNTPFEGMQLKGKVQKTMVAGNWVYDAEKGIL